MSGNKRATPESIRSWARHTHGSPLYAELAETVASSEGLLDVINKVPNLPRENVLLAAVHFLLLGGVVHPLRDFYASLVEDPLNPDGVADVFEDFVMTWEEQIVELGNARYTQTNECRRCVALLPGIWIGGLESFHLIDVGTSAGLNLGIDRYQYRWGEVSWGESRLLLQSESRGIDPVPDDIEILSRTGLDLNPVDASAPEERRWLQALIWPEHQERRDRLVTALDLLDTYDVRMVEGDAVETIPSVLSDLPANEAVVVMHSFALNQFGEEQRQALFGFLEARRAMGPVLRVSYEFIDKADEWARLIIDDGLGARQVGQGHPHGDWIELFEPQARP